MEIAGKAIVVTGAAGGFGRAIVMALLGQGARVAALDRSADGLEALAQGDAGIFCRTCDLADPDQVIDAVDAVHGAFGRIDALVNAVGMIHSAPLINLMNREERTHDVATWQTVLAANLTSVFLAGKQVAEKMALDRAKGVIVNISSSSAGGNAGQSAYSAAKAGVNALTKVWAKELGPLGIRVVAIAPGFIDNQATHEALGESALREIKRETPLRRLGDVDQVCSTVLYALENDFVTGTVLEVDGGLRS